MTLQLEATDASALPTAPPQLLIDARAGPAATIDPGQTLLGLSLLERLARAARRCGYGRVIVVANEGDVERSQRLLAGMEDIFVGAAPPATGAAARTVRASALILGERAWLE